MKHINFGALIALVIMAVGCGSSEKPAPAASTPEVSPKKPSKPAEWPKSDDSVLIAGRAVWLENCENCHGIGKAESPRFMDHKDWAPRLAKGEAELINSAINGFDGKSEAGMPPRGGNKEMTDEQGTAAAPYMIHFSSKQKP